MCVGLVVVVVNAVVVSIAFADEIVSVAEALFSTPLPPPLPPPLAVATVVTISVAFITAAADFTIAFAAAFATVFAAAAVVFNFVAVVVVDVSVGGNNFTYSCNFLIC